MVKWLDISHINMTVGAELKSTPISSKESGFVLFTTLSPFREAWNTHTEEFGRVSEAEQVLSQGKAIINSHHWRGWL